jgi:transcriptional regulator with XRE-family HTH domain
MALRPPFVGRRLTMLLRLELPQIVIGSVLGVSRRLVGHWLAGECSESPLRRSASSSRGASQCRRTLGSRKHGRRPPPALEVPDRLDCCAPHAFSLKELRLDAGLSLGRLSKRVGLSVSALKRIEEGSAKPSAGTLIDLAGHLGTTPTEVLHHANEGEATRAKSSAVSGPEQVGRAILDLPGRTDKLRVAVAAAVRVALEESNGNQSAAARLLGLERRAMMRRIGRSIRKARL